MCNIISLDEYRNRKQKKIENPNSGSDEEFAELEESIWQACKELGLDQFFINLFTKNIPDEEDAE